MDLRPTYAIFLPWALSERGGVNQVVLNLLRHCAASSRFQPLLIESDWSCPEPVFGDRFGIPSVRLRVRSLLSETAPWKSVLGFAARFPSESQQLRRLINDRRIAAVNVHFPGDLAAADFILFQKLGQFSGKVILSFHGSDIRSAWQSKGIRRAAYRWMLRHADHIAPCSQGLLEEVRMLEPHLRSSTVIYNGFDPKSSTTEPALAREPGDEVIVSVGRYEYRKGHEVLIEAFRKLAAVRSRLRLWIIGGEGPHLNATRAAAGTDPRIQLMVNVPHAQTLATIAAADLFGFASRWKKGEYGEGFPIALLEAGALGIPIATTRCCGADELIADREHGELVTLDDSSALAEAMGRLLDDRNRARQMGLRLQSLIASRFTWSQAWRQYESLA